ncbi:hypothetical protein ACVDFE_00230 [Lentzea chajnantorensis]
MGDQWTYELSQYTGPTFTTSLELTWEIDGAPFTDDYSPGEIDAVSLWRLWLERYYPDTHDEAAHGPGMIMIHWFVAGPEAAHFEAAPFRADAPDEHFLTSYTWPRHATTKEPLNWLTLPVADKLWRPGKADKGGFIQEATGWKPSPLQPVVHVPSLLAAVPALAGLARGLL